MKKELNKTKLPEESEDILISDDIFYLYDINQRPAVSPPKCAADYPHMLSKQDKKFDNTLIFNLLYIPNYNDII